MLRITRWTMNKNGFALMTLLSLLGAACSDGGDPSGPGGGGGAGGSPPPGIKFSVRIVDATASPTLALQGVEVCAADRPDVACATSDADGNVELSLPPGSELMLRCEGPSHGPMYMTWAIGESDIDAGTFSLLDKTRIEGLVTFSGAKEWPAKGAILANVYEDLVKRDQRVAGATFTITPAAGGPVYVSDSKFPDPSLMASTAGGPAVFFDADPGEVTIAIEHHTRACKGGFGWDAGSDEALRSKVFEGGLSSVTFVCPP
jgi:hypothetical protein